VIDGRALGFPASFDLVSPRSQTVAEPARAPYPGSDAIFDRIWWLEAVTLGGLEQAEVTWDRAVVGSIYFQRARRGLVRKAVLPAYTRLLTPYINPPGEKSSTRSANVVRIVRELYAKIDDVDYYHTVTQSDPELLFAFQMSNFSIGHKITFISRKEEGIDRLFSGMDHKFRNIIKVASKSLRLDAHMDIDRFRRIRSLVSKTDYNDYNVFESIVAAVEIRGAGTFLSAVSEDGTDQATIFVVWDADRLYYLSSTRLNTAEASKAATWLFSEAVAFAKSKGLDFDADGFATVATAKSLLRWGMEIRLNANVSRGSLAYDLMKPIKDRIQAPPF
jgi:hypothetical protein